MFSSWGALWNFFSHTRAHKRKVTKRGGGRKQRPRALCSRELYAKVVRARTSYRYKAFWENFGHISSSAFFFLPISIPFQKPGFISITRFQGGRMIGFFDFIDLGFFHGSGFWGGRWLHCGWVPSLWCSCEGEPTEDSSSVWIFGDEAIQLTFFIFSIFCQNSYQLGSFYDITTNLSRKHRYGVPPCSFISSPPLS